MCIDRVEDVEHLLGLFRAVTDHQATNAGIVKRAPAFFKVADDVVKHRLDKTCMGVDERAVYVAHFDFHVFQRLLQHHFVVGGDLFPDQA
ncbi:hypothetical protein D9M69_457670 [compost metagenome]